MITVPTATPGAAPPVPLWKAVLCASLAGGMGWGIRGQYGHETGAMIAGLLVGLVLVLLFHPHGSPLAAFRAVAFCAAAIGFGGAMTYGQTVGLTQNPEMVGNWAAWRWGMLGLGLKGALWIGFAGAFLGMGLGHRQYSCREMALILGGLLLLMLAGMWALNLPYDPARRILPRLYFSADWIWYPLAGAELKPRREFWGGFLFALAGLLAFLRWVRRDLLAVNLGLWGCVGGLGFPIGQCLQSWHAWNSPFTGFLRRIDPIINWWNFMETTFGLFMGAMLGLGLWLNRHRIVVRQEPPPVRIGVPMEAALLALHLTLLWLWEFSEVHWLDRVGDLGIPRSLIPLIAVAGGSLWPFWMAGPVIAFPIFGKTLGEIPPRDAFAQSGGLWFALVIGFTACLIVMATRYARRERKPASVEARQLIAPSLLWVTWLYFALNYAFFKFPWPWEAWTVRTPNSLIYTACALVLSGLAINGLRRR